MFAQMYHSISTSARDHLLRDAAAADILRAGSDPLALWQLMKRALVSSKIGSSVAMQEAALKSYNALKQTKDMSLADFFKAFKSAHKTIESVGCDKISDERQGHQFKSKLDLSRYAEIVNNIENGIMGRPNTAQAAYEVAAGWQTIAGGKTGNAFSAQESKKGGRRADREEKTKSARKPRPGHDIPREVMAEYRESDTCQRL